MFHMVKQRANERVWRIRLLSRSHNSIIFVLTDSTKICCIAFQIFPFSILVFFRNYYLSNKSFIKVISNNSYYRFIDRYLLTYINCYLLIVAKCISSDSRIICVLYKEKMEPVYCGWVFSRCVWLNFLIKFFCFWNSLL